MDPPPIDGGIEREMLEEVKEGGPLHHCNLFDAEVTHKIAEAFLPGLASACVDNTTGGLFKSPGSVAVDIRKEMVDSLIQRSETFVAEAVVLEGEAETEVPEHPFDIISEFIDDFASSKRNFFSRVSGWLLSDRREDRIDEFVQEMEINGFWMIGRRETIAQTLLKNVDFKDAFHCNKKFNSTDELVEHLPQCRFRTVHCPNEGCDDQFSAGNAEIHDAVCPFKMLLCEQNCSDILMRRDMDRHCITVCPMKLVNCPFSSVGCESSIPRCSLEQHILENVHAHVLGVLQSIHKEAATEDLKHRVDQLGEVSSPEQLAKAQNVRSLTTLIKNLEAKLGPLEVGIKPNTTNSEEIPSQCTDSLAKKEEHLVESAAVVKDLSDPPANSEEHKELLDKNSLSGNDLSTSQAKKEELMDSPTKDRTRESPAKDEHPVESSAVVKDLSDPPAKTEEHKESSDRKSLSGNDLSTSQAKKEELMGSPTKDRTRESPAKEEHPVESSAVAKDLSDPPAKNEEHKESSDRKSLSGNDLSTGQVKKEELRDSPLKDRTKESPAKEEHPVESASVVKHLSEPPAKTEEHKESSDRKSVSGNDLSTSQEKKEELMSSPTKDRTRESPAKENHPVESFAVAKDLFDPPAKTEEHKESSDRKSLSGNDLSTAQAKKEELKDSPLKDRTKESPAKEEHPVESAAVVKDLSDPPSKTEEHKESSDRKSVSGNDFSTGQAKKKELMDSPTKDKTRESPDKEEYPVESSAVVKDLSDPPAKTEKQKESSEEHRKSQAGNDLSIHQTTKEELWGSPLKDKTTESPAKAERPVESSTVAKDLSDPASKTEEHKESSEEHRKSLAGNDSSIHQEKKEVLMDSPAKDSTMESPTKEEHPVEPSAVVKDLSDPPAKTEEHKKSSEEHRKDEGTYSSTKEEEHDESLVRKDENKYSPSTKEEQKTLPVEREEHKTPINGEECNGLPKKNEEPPQERKVHEESSSLSSSEEAKS